jgi:hypothetical protein
MFNLTKKRGKAKVKIRDKRKAAYGSSYGRLQQGL